MRWEEFHGSDPILPYHSQEKFAGESGMELSVSRRFAKVKARPINDRESQLHHRHAGKGLTDDMASTFVQPWEAGMKIQDGLPKRTGVPQPVMCVRCDAPMQIRTIIPTMFANETDNIVYGCPSCGAETARTVPGSRTD
jgi:hypothetical protein